MSEPPAAPPTTETAPRPAPARSRLPVPRQSRLPVPKKAPVAPTTAPPERTVRPQPSRDRLLPSPAPAPKPKPKPKPTLAKRPSASRLNANRSGTIDKDAGSFTSATTASNARVGNKKPVAGYGYNALTGAPLTKKPSVASLGRKASMTSLSSTSSISRKPSIGSLPTSPVFTRQPSVSSLRSPISPRSPEEPPLARASNSQLQRPASRPTTSSGQLQTLGRKPSVSRLSSSASSSTLRKQPSFDAGALRPSSSSLRKKASFETTPKAPLVPRVAKAPPKPKAPPKTAKPPTPKEPTKTSNSLRDTIAAARAAAQKKRKPDAPGGAGSNDFSGFDFGAAADPFGIELAGEGGSVMVIKQRIKGARKEGKLNISALMLKEIPDEVYRMYEQKEEEPDNDGPAWYESVDVVKFLAADNEITKIEETLAIEFGGLTHVDLHNNALVGLPGNFGGLTELTSLNLSNNQFTNDALSVIFTLPSLKQLKLAKNKLSGDLSSEIAQLQDLELLELQENALTSFPNVHLPRLHNLNLSKNTLSSVPFTSLSLLPLVDLNLASNRISGELPDLSFPTLTTLNISCNGITSFGALNLPALKQFIISHNRLSSLPELETPALLSLLAESNKFSSLPDSFYSLPVLRTLDLSGNDFSSLDPRFGSMESLEILTLNGNPLRDRALVGASAFDVKKTLRARLAPEIAVEDVDGDGAAAEGVLEVSRVGTLDCSGKGIEEIDEAWCESVSGNLTSLVLSQNKLSGIPTVLSVFALQSLDLSHNRFLPEYLSSRLSLPALKSLTLISCNITSLSPLSTLSAPRLQSLTLNTNRLTALPSSLTTLFPELNMLLAADNQIEEIPLDVVGGLRVLDLSGNALKVLPVELGLLEGLRELKVGGNVFRVPGYRVLEKGTEYVKGWLRERIPGAEDEVD